jgi:DNA-binding LacI/PurR family transcriptional regulator
MSLKKIAEKTGVSAATVSRVLNDPDHRCSSPEIREKILQAAIDLQYSPNESARNLRRGQSSGAGKKRRIHVLMTRTDETSRDPFFDELLRIVETEIYRDGAVLETQMFLPEFSDEMSLVKRDIGQMLDAARGDTRGDGLIVIGKCTGQALSVLKQKYRAVVALNRNSTNYQVDEVLCDGQKVAAMATEYLISLGHSRIAYIGSCRHESRYRGFVDTLLRHNLELNPGFLIETEQTEATGYHAMDQILGLERRPTAIYCANDITAVGALRCLTDRRVKDYRPSVIAGDDIEAAQTTRPMLTTVRLLKEEMGKFAVLILLDRISGGHVSSLRLELEGSLIVRESCRAPE